MPEQPTRSRFLTVAEVADILRVSTMTVYRQIKAGELAQKGYVPVTVKQGFRGADCVLVLNNHQAYRDFDIYSLLSTMKKPGLFFDGWHMFDENLAEPVAEISPQEVT